MNYNIEFHPATEKEYIEAVLWYEEQLVGLGRRFSTSVEGKLNNVANRPEIYQKTRGAFREALVDDFPYVIVFKIVGSTIYISSIFHTSRNPQKKYRRPV